MQNLSPRPAAQPLRPPPRLRRRALRAYWWGRARWSASNAAWLAPLALWAALPGENAQLAPLIALMGLGLSFMAGLGRNAWGLGSRYGAWFGAVPLTSGLWMSWAHHQCSHSLCASVCLALGVVGGVVWAHFAAPRLLALGRGAIGAALLSALATSALGCSASSTGTTVGVLIGLLLAFSPLALLHHRAQAS